MELSAFDVDKKYNLIKIIGKGSAGSVHLCKSKRDFKTYAVKQICLDKQKRSKTKEIGLQEVMILQKLIHPHIVTYHEAFFDRRHENLFIIQDFCGGGSLYERVKSFRVKDSCIPEKQVMQWFVQITLGLRFIHGKRILHRDLKTQNVFLTKTDIIKIGDFGISRVLEHTVDMASTCVGTPCYLSPEICQDKPYNSKSDIWALGCLLYEICALKPAFNATNLVSLCYKIVKGDYEDIPSSYSSFVKMLIEKSLQKNPENRPSATAILNFPEIKEQLSVYIDEKESERKSAQIAEKKESMDLKFGRFKRKPTRPNFINIGADNKSKKQKKTKKVTNVKGGKKKKRLKSKTDIQDAEDVKNLRPEINKAEQNTPLKPDKTKDPVFPSTQNEVINENEVVTEYSLPTVSKTIVPKPKQHVSESKDEFMEKFGTVKPSTITLHVQLDESNESLGLAKNTASTADKRFLEGNDTQILYRIPKLSLAEKTATTAIIKRPSIDETVNVDVQVDGELIKNENLSESQKEHNLQPELLPGQTSVQWSIEPTTPLINLSEDAIYDSTKPFIPILNETQFDYIPEEIELELSPANVSHPSDGNNMNKTIQFNVEKETLGISLIPDVDEILEYYSDDFEEYDSQSDNDQLLNFEKVDDIPEDDVSGSDTDEDEENEVFELAMKSARGALNNEEDEEDDDEIVDDYVIPSNTGNIATLRQYCISIIGLEKFKEVQKISREFENNYDSHETFELKLENLAGKDNIEVCRIIDEFFADE